jgi:hypothetical protein
MTPPAQPKSASEFPKETIKQAIADGKAVLKEGKPKVEAAIAIFKKMKGADRETVVAAFVEGAGLTEKGALTYWYNCRRKSTKAKD